MNLMFQTPARTSHFPLVPSQTTNLILTVIVMTIGATRIYRSLQTYAGPVIGTSYLSDAQFATNPEFAMVSRRSRASNSHASNHPAPPPKVAARRRRGPVNLGVGSMDVEFHKSYGRYNEEIDTFPSRGTVTMGTVGTIGVDELAFDNRQSGYGAYGVYDGSWGSSEQEAGREDALSPITESTHTWSNSNSTEKGDAFALTPAGWGNTTSVPQTAASAATFGNPGANASRRQSAGMPGPVGGYGPGYGWGWAGRSRGQVGEEPEPETRRVEDEESAYGGTGTEGTVRPGGQRDGYPTPPASQK